MVKIPVTQKTKENFNTQIMQNFLNSETNQYSKKIEKKKDKKLLWSKSLVEINRVIKRNLKDFDSEITLQKLILADYRYIGKLTKYIDTHKIKTGLKPVYIDVFLTLYSRLKNVDFIKDLDVKVCPYCNRNYIFNFAKNKNKEATAQLDHFFDKKTYPYLAINLYNLVPSCSTCNQRKSTKQENIFYPYEQSFHESMKFSVKGIKDKKSLTLDDLEFFDENRIELDFIIQKNKEQVEKHMEVFNIDNLYNEHKDIVSELLKKRIIYPDSYIQNLLDEFEGKLFNGKDELLRLITCGYINDADLNKRPLSKLTKDISEDLGLI